MTELTTKTIINYLPLPSATKIDLLEKYDSLPREEQLTIADHVWQLFFDLYELNIQDNFDKGVAEADAKGEKLDQTFYGKVLKRTEEEVVAQLSSSSESVDLSEARASMEKIIREINATKASKVKN